MRNIVIVFRVDGPGAEQRCTQVQAQARQAVAARQPREEGKTRGEVGLAARQLGPALHTSTW